MSGEQEGEAAGETEGVQAAYSSEGPHGLGAATYHRTACRQGRSSLPAEDGACVPMGAESWPWVPRGQRRLWKPAGGVSLGSVEREPDRHLSYKIGAPSLGKQTTIGKSVLQK